MVSVVCVTWRYCTGAVVCCCVQLERVPVMISNFNRARGTTAIFTSNVLRHFRKCVDLKMSELQRNFKFLFYKNT